MGRGTKVREMIGDRPLTADEIRVRDALITMGGPVEGTTNREVVKPSRPKTAPIKVPTPTRQWD